jgi:hypothetical protein
MTRRQFHARCVLRAGAFATLLVPLVGQAAYGQTHDEREGFIVRELSLSTGYMGVQLPPITLGGRLPEAAVDEDLVTSATAGIDWLRVTPRTRYTFEFLGAYTARTRYSQLNAPVTDLTFGVSRAVGYRWRLGAAVANTMTGSDQLGLDATRTRGLVDAAATFDDLAGPVAFARSPAPDPGQAALFVPINQSLVGADLYRNRVMASGVRLNATYVHSIRLATSFRGSYTTVRQISSIPDPALLRSFPDSSVEGAGVGIRYDRSERTQLTANLEWLRASGASLDNVLLATVGYGWSGRKWFSETTVGVAVRPFRAPAIALLTTSPDRTPEIVYSGAIGYKFQAHTLLVGYSRAPLDQYGHGGRNAATGFAGNVHSMAGAWSWRAPRAPWLARTDLSMVRRPGNFSYIYAWLATAGIGRQLTRDVRLMGELLFDRHGSRGFEGFHLMREGARISVIWAPQRRRVEEAPPEQ